MRQDVTGSCEPSSQQCSVLNPVPGCQSIVILMVHFFIARLDGSRNPVDAIQVVIDRIRINILSAKS